MKKQLFLLLATAFALSACETLFDSKDAKITDEIFRDGRQDPRAVDEVVGYAAILPFFDGFDAPTAMTIGFDELIYVVDNVGLHVLDIAGRRGAATIPLQGANAVIQDRNMYVYVSARLDTTMAGANNQVDTWNLPVVYKFRNANGSAPLQLVDKIVFPFADATLPTLSTQLQRLRKNTADNYENVEITGLGVLADNSLYVARRGPRNITGQVAAPDNIVLEFTRRTVAGVRTELMQNTRQIRALSPTIPSLVSSIGVSSLGTFVSAPQRERMTEDRSFLVAQAQQNQEIPFRVLWITAVDDVDGLSFNPNTQLLTNQDTSRANGFLYEAFKFKNPSGVVAANDGTGFIFVTDAETDSVYQFQANGYEGVNPPVGSSITKPIKVSFGGSGNGPKEFNQPSGVAYFRRMLYVVDKGNNRIARYRLTTDFEIRR